MTDWKIKNTGKLFYLLVGLGFLVLIYFGIALHTSIHENISFIASLAGWAFVGSIFILAWLSVFPSLILRKKVPLQIKADIDQSRILFTFPKKKMSVLQKEEFSWCLYRYNFYSCLVIHKKVRSRRGHIARTEAFSIIGLPFSIGWHRDQLEDFADWLHLNNYELYKTPDKLFFQRLMN